MCIFLVMSSIFNKFSEGSVPKRALRSVPSIVVHEPPMCIGSSVFPLLRIFHLQMFCLEASFLHFCSSFLCYWQAHLHSAIPAQLWEWRRSMLKYFDPSGGWTSLDLNVGRLRAWEWDFFHIPLPVPSRRAREFPFLVPLTCLYLARGRWSGECEGWTRPRCTPTLSPPGTRLGPCRWFTTNQVHWPIIASYFEL